jgi:threonylcarbamoyladenosine tRNA methylthiotransferase MtaB
VNALVDAGYREVVISGINLGRWGRDLVWGGRPRPPRVEDLIREILDQTSLEKLRISSVEPMDWSDELIQTMAESPRIAEHAHVPLQSGSDRMLRAMHRKYRPWHYREKIEKIRAAMPTAAIGADVMVGFPGETDADFDETVRMVEALPLTYLHVFTYSPRPGTPAAAMQKQVPVQVARERNRILRELAAEKKLAFMRSFIGQKVEAITLHSAQALSSRGEPAYLLANQSGEVEGPAVFTEALTDNYLKLRLKGCHAPNRWVMVQVEQVEADALVGMVGSECEGSAQGSCR